MEDAKAFCVSGVFIGVAEAVSAGGVFASPALSISVCTVFLNGPVAQRAGVVLVYHVNQLCSCVVELPHLRSAAGISMEIRHVQPHRDSRTRVYAGYFR